MSMPLAVFGNRLIAGGDFTNAGGAAANYIARWDGGSWQPVGGGVNRRYVYALRVHKGELVVGGNFHRVSGSNPAPYIVRWNGSNLGDVSAPMPSTATSVHWPSMAAN